MKDNKKIKQQFSAFGIVEVVTLIVLTCLFSVASGVFLGGKLLEKDTTYNKIPRELEEIVDNYNYIIDNFYGEVNREELSKGAIKGMIESLGDKYTSFLDDEENERFNIQLKGYFTGLGLEIINNNNGDILIINVFEESPAFKAGLKTNDIIKKIDDIDLSGKTTLEFTDIVKQKKKTFNLLIERGDETIETTLKKGVVQIKTVQSKVYEKDKKKIGYLKIELFAENTYDQFKKELELLETSKIDSLIIDLRYNTGGHLKIVDKIISLFLDTSHVIYQTKTKKELEKFYSSGLTTKEYPIVVIGNGESASASEVMIGALRDEYGAKFVGEQTYGKGTVQILNKISSHDQYKMTTKRWLTPKGDEIEGVGIKPDYEIRQSEEYYIDFSEEKDAQLQKAIKVLIGN